MDVHLLVYDLSRGMARDMSMSLLGFQLDAIYHTSIQLNGLEYVYDGGIVAIIPGSSHLGRPLQQLHLGRTELPMDVIEEYLESLRPIYTAQAYDLFKHNCNNFSDAFARFLLGKGIPDHITNMPQAVLESPLGRMLLPQLTQAVNANRQNGLLGLQSTGQQPPPQSNGAAAATKTQEGEAKVVHSVPQLDAALAAASSSFAIVFFTSATCAPCHALYPLYEELAAEVGAAGSLIKVDTSLARDVAQQHAITATPTFKTFLRGEVNEEWKGADAARLRGTVRLLISLAAAPRHPHDDLYLPTFGNLENARPVLYAKVPPMAKLLAKMGDELARDESVQQAKLFLETSASQGPASAPLPDLVRLGAFLRGRVATLPPELAFAVVDLFRCALADPRVSGPFAEEEGHATVRVVLEAAAGRGEACPYALRLVTLQLACNLFSSPLFVDAILGSKALRAPLVSLVTAAFLDPSHDNVRVAAASLTYNLALSANHARSAAAAKGTEAGESEMMGDEDEEVEIAASLLEAVAREEKSAEALHGMLLALGHLVFRARLDGQVADLMRVMDAGATVRGKKKAFPKEELIREVGEELLRKGLARP